MFEEQYTVLQAAGDQLAERIRALGYRAPGRFQEFLTLSAVNEDADLPETPEAMLRNLFEDNQTCARQAADAIMIAESCEDYVTHDLLIERKAYHDKVSWMLRANLE